MSKTDPGLVFSSPLIVAWNILGSSCSMNKHFDMEESVELVFSTGEGLMFGCMMHINNTYVSITIIELTVSLGKIHWTFIRGKRTCFAGYIVAFLYGTADIGIWLGWMLIMISSWSESKNFFYLQLLWFKHLLLAVLFCSDIYIYIFNLLHVCDLSSEEFMFLLHFFGKMSVGKCDALNCYIGNTIFTVYLCSVVWSLSSSSSIWWAGCILSLDCRNF